MIVLGLGIRLFNHPVQAAFGIANPKQEQSMLWPLLPGESVNSLAAKLYPQSPVLQQRFVQQSLTLSRSRGILLKADQAAKSAQLIAVPNAQTLHTITHRIKKADEVDPQTFVTPGLVMSVQLSQDSQQSGWHWPKLTLPALHLPEGLSLKGYSFSAGHLVDRIAAVKAHLVETYQANAQAIAKTPVKRLYQTPQVLVIVVSAVLLLGLSLVWGILEERRDKR
ncbi:hypothetical protein [Methylophilus sp. TWE2]|uniref:hypothetical protein n=1 Tax=Methylophilus sp. TWE2 TaxID=1662285 RepID=UPI000670D2B5|nr:hypothetical protein [Methylophilus sp. TWE2]AKR44495.1 hypothetical protein ACJ67_00385 [Methylophilus sp. TWE2]